MPITASPPEESLIRYLKKKLHQHRYGPVTDLHITETSLGNRNKIYYVTTDEGNRLVFKGYQKKERLKNALISGRFLARNDINVPRILFSDTSRKTYDRFGFYCTCEEKIDAVSMADCEWAGEYIPNIAQFYAGLHSLRSSRWGKFISLKKYGLINTYDKNITKRLNLLSGNSGRLSVSEKNKCLHWFNSTRDQVKKIKLFSLCHGDVNKKNILVNSSGTVYIIDNEAVRYQPYVLEYYRLYYILCENNAELQKRFAHHYRSACPPTRLHELETCGSFFSCYVILELAAYYNRKLRSSSGDTHDYFSNNVSKAITELKKAVLH